MYLLNNEVYPNQRAVLEKLELSSHATFDADLMQQHAIEKVRPIFPLIDKQLEYHTIEGGELDAEAKTYQLGVAKLRLYVLVAGDVVQAISKSAPQVSNDNEQAGWMPVPFELNAHIQPGWKYDDEAEAFTPPSIEEFRYQLKEGSNLFAADVRQKLSGAVDHTEVGGWLMNAIGVMLKQAGLDAPSYDMALATESAMTGESVDDLITEHAKRAGQFHGLFALVQGMRRATNKTFDNPDLDVAGLISVAAEQKAAASQKLAELGGA